MKKKLLATVSALACAATCAFGLAACTDDNAKTHTEEQWKAALTAEITESKSFHLIQSNDKIQSDGTPEAVESDELYVYTDSVNTYYYTVSKDEDNKTYKSYLLKKGDRYYHSISNGKYAEEISAEYFATTEGYYKKYIEDTNLYFGMIEARYDDFGASGSGSATYTVDGVDKVIEFSSYSAENIELTFTHDDKTQKLTAERVDVNIEIETGVLDSIYFRQVAPVDNDSEDNELMSFSYSNDYGELDFDLPELPEFVGKTFYIFNAEVDDDDYENIVTGMMLANKGKTVTFKADGTFAGDIAVNDGSITTYTWEDDPGYITMTSKNPDLPDAEGKFEYDEEDEAYKLVLEMRIKLGENGVITDTVVLTLELRYADEAAE